jgi:hypothetical protein
MARSQRLVFLPDLVVEEGGYPVASLSAAESGFPFDTAKHQHHLPLCFTFSMYNTGFADPEMIPGPQPHFSHSFTPSIAQSLFSDKGGKAVIVHHLAASHLIDGGELSRTYRALNLNASAQLLSYCATSPIAGPLTKRARPLTVGGCFQTFGISQSPVAASVHSKNLQTDCATARHCTRFMLCKRA